MEKYLDPRADLTFKKVFGEHPDLVTSLLNALLPLPEGQEITGIEYLPSELVPETPLRKNSIVDVRCRDASGRQFIVEMQMVWSKEFQYRVLFNASKAYVRQLKIGEYYELLQPVYSLNLVNEIFESDLEGFYHYYRLVHEEHSDRVIDGLHLVFVELPKFKPQSFSDKKMQALWLRFMTEVNEQTDVVSPELLADPLVKKAVSIVRESAFTPGQLEAYDRFWDAIRVEKALVNEGERRGLKRGKEEGFHEGREEGIKEGLKEGIKEGRREGLLFTARKLKEMCLSIEEISRATGLDRDEIEKL